MKLNKIFTIISCTILITVSGLLCEIKPVYSLPADDVIPLVDAEYYPAVHKALADAKKSILCVMFMAKLEPKHTGSAEYQLVLDLINAHKRGVKVKIIFDQNVKFWEKKAKNAT